MKSLHHRLRHRHIAVFVFGLLLQVVIPPTQAGEKIKVSKETTFVTGPLTKDGYVDFRAALNEQLSQGVTAENNAVVLLAKAIGPSLELPDDFFKRYGIKRPPAKGDYFTDLHEHPSVAAKLANLPGDLDQHGVDLGERWSRAMDAPWQAKEFPLIAEWLHDNEKPLAVAIQATTRTRYFYPLVDGPEELLMFELISLASIQQQRELARKLDTRAMLRIGSGDLEGAWNDLLAIHRLARLMAKGPSLVDVLVGTAIDSIACAGDQVLANQEQLTAKQAMRMQKELASLPPLKGVADSVDLGERLGYLDLVQYVTRKPGKELETLLGVLNRMEFDELPVERLETLQRLSKQSQFRWEDVMRYGNQWCDRCVVAGRITGFKERDSALAKLDVELEEAVEAWKKLPKTAKSFPMGIKEPDKWMAKQIANGLAGLLMPVPQFASRMKTRSVCKTRAALLAFALAAYCHDHGGYPEKLKHLVPKYIADVPENPFDNDLKFTSNRDGYSLTFVGPADRFDVTVSVSGSK